MGMEELKLHAVKKEIICTEMPSKLYAILTLGFLGVLIFSKSADAQERTTPSAPLNGQVTCSKEPIGASDTCTFICLDGFELSGTGTLTCGSDGNFDNAVPTCEAVVVTCTNPSNPANGQVTCTNDPSGASDTCTFTCLDGFELSGTGTLTCGSDGNFDNAVPTCQVITCAIPDLRNTTITCDSSEGQINETCNVTCDDGYMGVTNVTCLDDGTWDSKDPSCKATTCPIPTLTGTTISCQSSEGTVGESCTVTCDAGYSGDGSVTCQNDGTWSPADPSCKDIDECGSEADNNCDANANCSNKPGSFTCTCKEGFKGDGIECNGASTAVVTTLASIIVCLVSAFIMIG